MSIATQERHVAVTGGKLFYRTAGSGSAVVLLHGYSVASTVWAPYFERLSQRHRVLAFDLPGHGGSERINDNFSHANAAELILESLKGIDAEKYHIVGQSSGGLIALHMALRQPTRALSLVTIDTPWRASEATRKMVGQTTVENAPPPMLEQLKRWHPGGISQIQWILSQMSRMSADPTEMAFESTDFRNITVPTLVVHGDQDEYLPVETALDLFNAIPNAALLVVPDARHGFILERNTSSLLFETALIDFLLRADT
jgi:pimeloyl-ACP methyl ester carboxylesterase